MQDLLKDLEESTTLQKVKKLIETIVQEAPNCLTTTNSRRLFLRTLFANKNLVTSLSIPNAVDHLLAQLSPEQFQDFFALAIEKELPQLMVDLVDTKSAVSHHDLLRLIPTTNFQVFLALLKSLSAYTASLTGSKHFLHGMRVARIQVDIYRHLNEAHIWKNHVPPPCSIDDEKLSRLKKEMRIAELPAAYESRIGQLQRLDLQHNLAAFTTTTTARPQMCPSDFRRIFHIDAPLRLGISSANASDNHIRSKEQGGKTLNAGIDLQMGTETTPTPPLQIQARRLPHPCLKLHSRSQGFKADFEADDHDDRTCGYAVPYGVRARSRVCGHLQLHGLSDGEGGA